MPLSSLIVRCERVVLPEGVRSAGIHVVRGRIEAILDIEASVPGATEVDARHFVVLPGLIDTHVHINEPGRAEWEGFQTATHAAAASGITTLVDMPLNSVPPTTDVRGLEAKRRVAVAGPFCEVDVEFWGGIVPGNQHELEPLARAGVRGFKCFLSPSGVDEFQHVTEHDLREALLIASKLGLPVLVHAEWPPALRAPQGNPRSYATWLSSRPPEAEQAAIELLIRLSRECDVHIHVVHLASADALPAIAAARRDGVRLTVETCPHYLTFAAEEIPDGATAFKCAPPIRGRDHRERLWQGLADGTIDLIATDHSPAPPNLKHLDDGDFIRAWGGIASLELSLAAVWTGARARGFGIDRVVEWMSAAPARLAGVDRTMGRIAPGYKSDLVVWDPDAEFIVDPARLMQRHPITPYQGMPLHGVVRGIFWS